MTISIVKSFFLKNYFMQVQMEKNSLICRKKYMYSETRSITMNSTGSCGTVALMVLAQFSDIADRFGSYSTGR